VVFLAVCAVGTWLLRDVLADAVWVIPFAAGHFFLFCNVFRVRRKYELLWAGYFLVNAAAWWTVLGHFPWLLIFALQTPATLAAIVAEIRSPHYHGIFCRNR